MISLAANGYADLYALLDRGDVPVDYIKCPLSPNSRAEVARAMSYRPVVLHCWGPPGYSATRPEIPEPDLLVELAALTPLPFASVHLDHQPSLDGEMTPQEVLARVEREVAKLRALTGKEILLENVPWYPWMERPRWGTDPEFIRAALERSGAGFLLDLAHARVAAWHRETTPEAYLESLPLDCVREVHLSGPRMTPEGLRDRHMGLEDVDFELLEFVLARTPAAQLITHEYAGRRDKTVGYGENDGTERLLADLERLDQIRRAVRHNLEFRSATLEDGEALADLRAEAMRPALEATGRFDPVRVRKMLLDTFDPTQTVCAFHRGALVGFYTLRDEADHWYLHHLYVHPDFQGDRVGSVLIERILRQARAKPKPIRLRAFRTSDANRFYQRHGFVPLRTEEWDTYYERSF